MFGLGPSIYSDKSWHTHSSGSAVTGEAATQAAEIARAACYPAITMPPTLGATIAALVEVAALTGANTGPDEPATAMSTFSTLGVPTRDHAATAHGPSARATPPASGAAHRQHPRPRTPRLPTTTRGHRGRPTPPTESTERRRRTAPGTEPRHRPTDRPGPVGGSRRSIVNTP
ncbi:conserved hypothetical protein [Rhodococcus jostii RHA1]|uniref:Uncharacterized protein n=1 Tax=Rhodococcus jostii (strain RHA1) TaxID=101510 RepID=Q0SIR5_RHOJR|nr:conserved hypothetical protein [Rhodococcus jostii RHA1]